MSDHNNETALTIPEQRALSPTQLSITERIRQALTDLRTAERELQEYLAEWAPVFEHRDALQEEVELCKQALLEVLTEANLDLIEDDQATVTVVRADRGTYDVERLPKTPEVLEACQLTIDKRAVERLIRRGVITQAQAEAAWVSKPVKPYLKITPMRHDGGAS